MEALKVRKPFELEHCQGKTIAHFEPVGFVLSGKEFQGKIAVFLAFLFGWLPSSFFGVLVALPFMAIWPVDESGLAAIPGVAGFVAGWVMLIKFARRIGRKAREASLAHGSNATTIIFEKDKVRASSLDKEPVVLAREEIGEVFSNSPDTSYTYNGRTDRAVKEAVARNKAKTAHAVIVEYGQDRIPIVPGVLSELQADRIRDLVTNWRDDPSSIVTGA